MSIWKDKSIKVIVFPHWINLADLLKSIFPTYEAENNGINQQLALIKLFLFHVFQTFHLMDFASEEVLWVSKPLFYSKFSFTLVTNTDYWHTVDIWFFCSWRYNKLFIFYLFNSGQKYWIKKSKLSEPLCFSAVYTDVSWHMWLPSGTSCSLSQLPVVRQTTGSPPHRLESSSASSKK